MMRIGIDAHGVGGHSLGHGNESYFKHLVKGLLEIDRTNEYHVFVNYPADLAAALQGVPNVRLVSLWPKSQWLQRPFSLPLYAARHRLDVLHCPFVLPPVVTARTVITVHDLSFEEFPQHFRRFERWRMKYLVPRSCERSDSIFTVSEYVREQLQRFYRVPADKIVVTYNSADHAGPREHGPWPPPQGLAGTPYVLYVGLVQPRKNIVGLVHALDRLRARGLPHHLVVAGAFGWGNEELMDVVRRSPNREAIHFLGYVPQAAFSSLMSNADAFAFPSHFEGFGIPPMEAQRWGVPALVSDNSCFPEIYGDSVAYCDPGSAGSIADALQRLLTDGALRDRLRRAGFERSRRYSWQDTARTALAAYERLAAAPAPQVARA